MKKLFRSEGDGGRKDNPREAEKKRLKAVGKQAEEHASKTHADFLDKVVTPHFSDHVYRMEHHGEQYWRFFDSNDERRAILNDQPVGQHEYGTFDDQERMQAMMLAPNTLEVQLDYAGMPIPNREEQIASYRLWLDHQQVGELAFSRQDYPSAESNLRLAWLEARGWGPCAELAKTTALLCKALKAQGKINEAEALSPFGDS